MKIPELLSPAGSAPAMVAAVQCGADAVYLGAGDFNARRTAENFGGELDAAVLYCHARDVRVYVTLNTIVRQDELSRLEKTIVEIAEAGADGVIVQDIGVARALREMVPSLPLHASTQMAVHNARGAEFLAKQGFRRVVLAREMTFREIARCKDLGAELEIFIHGALCSACSGQCYMSSIIGGRSGNRGMCAQPCRMSYELDGREGYLLSTSDLCSLDNLSALIESGADSLKIEGRLKRPEYVGETTRVYREALEALRDHEIYDTGTAKKALRQMFNRGGFTDGYGPGAEENDLLFSGRPNHLGIQAGMSRANGSVTLSEDISERDALLLRAVRRTDRPVKLSGSAGEQVPLREAVKGDMLVRLVSDEQMKRVQARFSRENKKTPAEAELTLRVGEPAVLTVTDGAHAVRGEDDPVEAAQNKPFDEARAREQLMKTGEMPFVFTDIRINADANAFMPVSKINALRRTCLEKLLVLRGGAPKTVESGMRVPEAEPAHAGTPKLLIENGDPAVLRRASEKGCLAAFTPEDLRPEALERAAEALPPSFELILPPVMTDRTMDTLHAWAEKNRERISRTWLSNAGQFALGWPGEKAGDYYLNIANTLALSELAKTGVALYTPSIELNCAQMNALGGRRALPVYGRLPLMLLRHCPLRAKLGLEGKHAFCRHCDADSDHADLHALTDRTGASFPFRRIASGDGCVLELLNSAPLMLLRRTGRLPAAEIWRLHPEKGEDIERLIDLHFAAAEGRDIRGRIEEMDLKDTTTGHYFRGVE